MLLKLSREEIKAAVLRELSAACADPLDPRELEIVGAGKGWRAVLRTTTPRINEAQLAAVCEVARRLSLGYSVA